MAAIGDLCGIPVREVPDQADDIRYFVYRGKIKWIFVRDQYDFQVTLAQGEVDAHIRKLRDEILRDARLIGEFGTKERS